MRKKIELTTIQKVTEFVQEMNQFDPTTTYTIENVDSTHRVNACSYLGMVYAASEFGKEMYLVNESGDTFPPFIKKYSPCPRGVKE